MNLEISFGTRWLSKVSVLFYLMALYAHQQETTTGTIIRYAALAFVIAAYLIDYPPYLNDKEEMRINLSVLSIWFLFILTYGLLSIFWCIEGSNVTHTCMSIFKVAIVCMVVSANIRTQKDIETFIGLLLVALIYMAAFCVIRTPLSYWGTERIGSALGVHSNAWGRACGVGALLSFYYLWTTKKYRLFFLGLVCGFSGLALMSGSKNSLLIILFELGLFYFLCSDLGNRVFLIFAGALAVVLIWYLIMEVPLLYRLLGYRIERMLIEIGVMEGVKDAHGSTSERIFFMQTAWELFKRRPVFGIGFNNFSSYLKSIRYRNPVYSHCGYLELLSTTGLVGFVSYYWIYFFTLPKLWTKAKLKDPFYVLVFVMLARILIFDISSISLYNYCDYFLLMLGVSLVTLRKDSAALL